MINILKKIGLYFAKEIHLSKFKLLITIPILIAVLSSFTFDINWETSSLNYSKDHQDYSEFITLIIFIVTLVIIDVVYVIINNNYKSKRRERRIRILENPNLTDSLKEIFLNQDE